MNRRAFFGLLLGSYLAALFRLIPGLKVKPATSAREIEETFEYFWNNYRIKPDPNKGFIFYDLPSCAKPLYPQMLPMVRHSRFQPGPYNQELAPHWKALTDPGLHRTPCRSKRDQSRYTFRSVAA